MNKNLRVLFVMFGLSAVLSACGYTFQNGGSVLPPDIKKIYIPLTENNTAESGLSVPVTEALRDRFERFGVFMVVEDLHDADAVLRSKIKAFSRDTRSVTSNTDTALQNDATLNVAAELKRIDGTVLWRESDVRVTSSYGTTSGVVVTSSPEFSLGNISAADLANLDQREVARGQEQQLVLQLSDDLAARIYTDAVSPDF